MSLNPPNEPNAPGRVQEISTGRSDVLLEIVGLSKSYGAVTALRNVQMQVRRGEVVALAGDNGAGKSTLIKILSGIVAPDGGEIIVEGRQVRLHQPSDATRLGIQTVYQDLALCANLDAVDNIFLGREERKSAWLGFRLKGSAMERTARGVLDSVGIKIKDINLPVATLSGGQQQAVAVCRAILGDPKLVILDEPTAALGVSQTQEVLHLIRRLRDQGRAVIVVSHALDEVLQVADRIVVLRLGETVADKDAKEWDEHSLILAIAGATRAVGNAARGRGVDAT
jgi:D-xylose transport system ATP-binding protein